MVEKYHSELEKVFRLLHARIGDFIYTVESQDIEDIEILPIYFQLAENTKDMVEKTGEYYSERLSEALQSIIVALEAACIVELQFGHSELGNILSERDKYYA